MSDLDGIDVVVLAGGLGSRIRHVLGDIPKVLAPIHERPFIDYILDQFQKLGAGRIILSLGFLADKVEAHLKTIKSTIPVITVHEQEPLGTCGALRNVMTALKSDPVLVINGDTWLNTNYREFLEEHKRSKKKGSILCVLVPDVSRYGTIELDKNASIIGFHEKQNLKKQGLVSGGVYLFNHTSLSEINNTVGPSLEKDYFAKCAPGTLHGLVAKKATFIDIGTPETLESAASLIPKA